MSIYNHVGNPLKDKETLDNLVAYHDDQQKELSFLDVKLEEGGFHRFSDIEIAMSDNADISSVVSSLDRRTLAMSIMSIPKGDSLGEDMPIVFGKEHDEVANIVKSSVNALDGMEKDLQAQKERDEFFKTMNNVEPSKAE